EVAPVGRHWRHGVAPGLAPADAVLQEVLRAFLVVHDERDGDARVVGPRYPRRLVRVADQVTFHPAPAPLGRGTLARFPSSPPLGRGTLEGFPSSPPTQLFQGTSARSSRPKI